MVEVYSSDERHTARGSSTREIDELICHLPDRLSAWGDLPFLEVAPQHVARVCREISRLIGVVQPHQFQGDLPSSAVSIWRRGVLARSGRQAPAECFSRGQGELVDTMPLYFGGGNLPVGALHRSEHSRQPVECLVWLGLSCRTSLKNRRKACSLHSGGRPRRLN